ncbi:uncharacterized protein LOC110700230 [Chenopodium quinoa]|uniref:uncharacterized protein LOC110700230 n=1 Tax=Chenopodium quinoa TaxID=63459 RepID=UPI000B7720C0|nr:uncharacterized protein LOC110700230 [Chenopodium quinoa]
MVSQEIVPPHENKEPTAEVYLDHDTEPEVETYTTADESLITRCICSKDTRNGVMVRQVRGLDDAAWYRCFPAMQKGIAQQWFGNLLNGCINNFRMLAFLFASNFFMNIPAKKTSLDLGAIQQGDREGLRSYVRWFNLVTIQIQGLSDDVAYTNLFKGLKDGSAFKFDLFRKRISTLQEALMEAEAYIQETELYSTSKQSDSKKSDKQKGSRQEQPAHKAEESKKRKEI